jgi:5-oxoprolinase (ATP-hydrolysing) subunit A
VALKAQTICIHGDTPGATAIAAEVRRALRAAGVTFGGVLER